MIFHIALESDWRRAEALGEYRISTLGRTLDQVGFIHCSYADQWAGVASAFYSEVTEPLVLLEIDPERLEVPVVDEPAVPGSAPGSAGAALFPHVYGPVPVGAIVRTRPVRVPAPKPTSPGSP